MKDFLGIMPTEEKDYITLGKWMIAKKIVMLGISLLCLLVIGYVIYTNRAVETFSGVEEKTFYYNDNALAEYTGLAVILKSVDGQDQVVYKGDIVAGKCTGKGEVYDLQGNLIYEGMLAENNYEGKGILYGENGMRYEGDFVEGHKEGEGKVYNANNQLIYEGQFSNDYYNGKGTLYNKITGEWYTGEFKEGVKEGQGILYNKQDEVIFDGTYKNNLFWGDAFRYWYNRSMYVGSYVHGQREGYGKEYNTAGHLVYEGMLSLGKRHGEGIEYDGIDGRKLYEGEFVEGERQGEGTLYNAIGKVIVKGQFFKGQIDYGVYLGEEMNTLQEVFQEEAQLITTDYQTAYLYPEAGVALIPIVAKEQRSDEQAKESTKDGQNVSSKEVVQEPLVEQLASEEEKALAQEGNLDEMMIPEEGSEKVEKILVLNQLEELPSSAKFLGEGQYPLNLITSLEGSIIHQRFTDFNEKKSVTLYKRTYETELLKYELVYKNSKIEKPLYYIIQRK